MSYKHIAIEMQHEGLVLGITLNRPDLRNAFNAELVDEIMAVFREPAQRKGQIYKQVRLITISGTGDSFCAGSQLSWLRDSAERSEEENFESAQQLTRLYYSIEQCDYPVIAAVQGFTIGPGIGLISACDHVVSADNCAFTLAEAKLGLVQAPVAPFLLNKVGYSHTRSLLITGDTIDAKQAREIGLVHEVVPVAELSDRLAKVVDQILLGSPNANEAAKRVGLLPSVLTMIAKTSKKAMGLCRFRTSKAQSTY